MTPQLQTVYNALEARGCHPKRNGEGWVARCPYHNDTNPSLGFKAGDQQPVVISCGAGCETVNVLSALGLTEADLCETRQPASKIVDTYSYVDEQGNELFEKVRFQPKDFRIRRRVNGAWEWKKGDRSVLYNLPAVLQAVKAGWTVVIVEGEKDADVLIKMGKVATCNPEGAALPGARTKWRKAYADTLDGAGRVVVWRDKDEAGYAHAAAIVKSLEGRVGELVVVEAKTGKDAADHFAAEHTIDDVVRVPREDWFPTAAASADSADRESARTTPETTPDALEVPQEGWRDVTVAELFVKLHKGRVRYDHTQRRWLLWDGRCWNPDLLSGVFDLARETARKAGELSLNMEATTDEQRATQKRRMTEALKYLGHSCLDNVLKEAATMQPVAINRDSLNREPWLLNVYNGTLDLKTSQLRPHDPADMFDYVLPVPFDPAATCPRWERFLLEILKREDTQTTLELVDWVQRAIGYTLTGDTTEQVFFTLYGDGCNGKSVFLEVLRALFGPMARSISANTLMQDRRRGNDHSEDVAVLDTARFVAVSEFPENQRLNEGLIKDLTGGDTIRARYLYSRSFEFTFQGTLWVRCNDKPVVYGSDEGVWRRVRLIHFQHNFENDPNRDPNLTRYLAENELTGILAWSVQGLNAWREEGLKAPDDVKEAVAEYRNEMDVVRQFVDDHCEVGNQEWRVPKGKLLERFKKTTAIKMTSNTFTRRMNGLIESGRLSGVEERQVGPNRARCWTGIRIVEVVEVTMDRRCGSS